jgi:hypothetical protein
MIRKDSWAALTGEMLRRRLVLEQVSPRLYPTQPFGVRGSEDDIRAAQTRLGHPLDTQHAAVLREVNGWRDAFAHADLLSTHDLGAGPTWERATTMLRGFYEDGPAIDFPPRESIYPFHVGETDLFVIDTSGPLSDDGRPVFWLAGELLDSWPNVYEFWLAGFTMLDRLTERQRARRQGSRP